MHWIRICLVAFLPPYILPADADFFYIFGHRHESGAVFTYPDECDWPISISESCVVMGVYYVGLLYNWSVNCPEQVKLKKEKLSV